MSTPWMRGLIVAFLGWVALLGPPAWGAPGIPAELRRALGRRAGELAVELAEQELALQPDNLAAHDWLGGALAVANRPLEAIAAFEQGGGSPWYVSSGIRLHAEALRAVGRGAEAAALRAEGRGSIDLLGPTALSLEINILEDLMAAGDFDAALEQAELVEAVAARPARAHSVIADLHRQMGNDDEMLWHLFLAERGGNSHYRAAMVRMEVARSDGRIEDAVHYSEVIRQNHIRLPTFWADKADILREIDAPAMGLHRLDTRRFRGHAHPELFLVQVRLYLAMADVESARATLDRLTTLFPALPQTERAWEAWEAGPWPYTSPAGTP